MDNNKYILINYRIWNRHLVKFFWMCNIIVFAVEIIIAQKNYSEIINIMKFSDYIILYIIRPSTMMTLIILASEGLLLITKNKFIDFQPYIITLTCVLLSAVLISVHYGINVIFVTIVIPLIVALAYDSKRVLRFTFVVSFLVFVFSGIAKYMYPERDQFLKLNFEEISTTIAILIIVYLICETILSRFNEIINIMLTSEREKDIAEAALNVRTRFLANMSHEIRTPMNGILGLVELALDNEASLEKKDRYLIKVRNNAVLLLNIINDILDISTIDSGNITLRSAPFSLSKVLKECEELIEVSARKKGLRLYFYNMTNLDSLVIGDSTRLRQAILNLLSNAIKFTHKGSITLLVKNGEMSVDENKVSLYFEIIDTGIGMTNSQFAEVFKPFKQIDDSDSRGFDGAGLGLPITKNLLEAMGSKIHVESLPNIGSKFYFTLELTLAGSEVLEEDVNGNRLVQPIFKGDVLLCEDNVIGTQVAKENLEKLGLNVVVASNGEEGVNIACRRQQEGGAFDIILMDIHMPVMDGLQATKKLIKMNIKTPIIAMTANVMPENRKAYLNAGMAECLYKPFRAQQLWVCLSNYITPIGSIAVSKTPIRTDCSEVVDKALGIENSADNEELYNKSLKAFSKEQPKTIETLEKAIKEKNYPLAREVAHTAKNNAKIIGAVKLAEILTILEESFRYDGSYFKIEIMDSYREELSKVLQYISKADKP